MRAPATMSSRMWAFQSSQRADVRPRYVDGGENLIINKFKKKKKEKKEEIWLHISAVPWIGRWSGIKAINSILSYCFAWVNGNSCTATGRGPSFHGRYFHAE
jgi:hypothetical protein